MRKRVIFTALLLSLSFVSEAAAGWIWTPQSRRWVNPKSAAKDTPRAQMDWAVTFFESRDYAKAAKEFLKLVRSFPRSELAPEAQYLAGVSYELMGDLSEAYAAYKKLVEIYPFSPRFKDAIEREFAIAETLFGGKRLKLIGPISTPSLDKAIEIYEHVVTQAPYGDYGARAQFRLGECYVKQQRFEEGCRAFQKVVDEYPTSPLAEESKFNIGFCSYRLSLKPSYDQSATDEALDWFERFIANHPNSSLIPEAKESIKKLKEFKAQGLAQSAEFYEIQGKKASAVLYYRRILEQYPDSVLAPEAAAKVAEYEKSIAAAK